VRSSSRRRSRGNSHGCRRHSSSGSSKDASRQCSSGRRRWRSSCRQRRRSRSLCHSGLPLSALAAAAPRVGSSSPSSS
jgi:hypothetical protein